MNNDSKSIFNISSFEGQLNITQDDAQTYGIMGYEERKGIKCKGVTNQIFQGRRLFSDHRDLFLQKIQESMVIGELKFDLDKKIDKLLLICDRLVAGYGEDPYFHKIKHIPMLLEQKGSDLMSCYQWSDIILEWLRLIFFVINSKTSINKSKVKKMSFSELLVNLKLERQYCFQSFLRSKHMHNISNLVPNDWERIGLVSLLTPVYIYKKKLTQYLRGCILNSIENSNLTPLLGSIRDERNRHIKQFAAREEIIGKLFEIMTSDKTGFSRYFMLVGDEGTGKTALCSKLSEQFASMYTSFGPREIEVKKYAPWIPGVIMHYGKQSNQPYEIVLSLIEQANTLLLHPIQTKEIKEVGEMKEIEHKLIEEKIGLQDKGFDFEKLMTIRRNNLVQSNEKLSRYLYQALDQLSKELGHVVVLIDALDEISQDGETLSFLPKSLPDGVVLLMTTRPGQVEKWVCLNRPVETFTLNHLTREEIPLLTGIPDEGSEERSFNDKVMEASDGWPLLVSAISKEVRRCNFQIDKVEIYESRSVFLDRMAENWQSYSISAKDNEILEELLPLLALFEPVAPLHFSDIQSYLHYHGFYLNKPRLIRVLKLVEEQIEGLKSKTWVKLRFKVFAEYVREEYYSPIDMEEVFINILDWIASLKNVTEKKMELIEKFFIFYTDKKNCEQLGVEIDLLQQLKERGCSQLLFNLSDCLIGESKTVGKKCLLFAIDLENVDAMRKLAWHVINDEDFGIDKTYGENLLRQAIDLGCIKSMYLLGVCLIDGNLGRIDVLEGEQWLRKAAENGEVQAMLSLGIRFLTGNGFKQNSKEGEMWLIKATQTGDLQAKRIYGGILFEGEYLNDRERGKKLLREAAKEGDQRAMLRLGVNLVDNYIDKDELEEGEMWLRRAAQQGIGNAILALAGKLYEGVNLKTQWKELEVWLNKIKRIPNIKEILMGVGAVYYKANNYLLASKYFLECAESQNYGLAYNLLAYMKRREEIPQENDKYSFDELIRFSLESEEEKEEALLYATINNILNQVASNTDKESWYQCDQTIAEKGNKLSIVTEWWYNLVDEADPERDLVIGWLVRHKIIDDPDGMSIKERMKRAREGGWKVPEWMDDMRK
ncbi:MAG: AAA family ATPase [Thermoactinomyces vulgaris]|nr:AAA family ATPase [Thermoactinomyces vulgaris]MBH8583026.1 SEL1-like repeat protein [Thermoactinomyces sp. CICC 10735]QBK13625.1 ATP-binding protein [Thermoactinomyces vulgaris]QCV54990.1 ATP-binding protein [Thermoactinomyces vulgaris]